MRKVVFVALGLASLGAFLGWDDAQNPREWQCTGNPDIDWDQQIAGCTQAISSGKYSGKGLIWAYNNRGNAWRAKGDSERAIADFVETSKLDPKLAKAMQQPRQP